MHALPERATPPCLSVYQTTHLSHPDNQQDPTVDDLLDDLGELVFTDTRPPTRNSYAHSNQYR
jgi:hypothetical protein